MSNYVLYFSPTDGTKKVTSAIAKEFEPYQEIDLSKQDLHLDQTFHEDDVCIVGVPSFGGRVPSIALERMQNIEAKGSKAILVVAYGNRAYDDTLLELKQFLSKKHFTCIAAVTAIAEHSIMHQFATNRPTVEDIDELHAFSKQIKDILNQPIGELEVPGNVPYRAYNGVPIKPKATSACSACGLCANMCPVGAIPMDKPNQTNKDICISCMRCVAHCPEHARVLNTMLVKVASAKMKKACSEAKANELFLARRLS